MNLDDISVGDALAKLSQEGIVVNIGISHTIDNRALSYCKDQPSYLEQVHKKEAVSLGLHILEKKMLQISKYDAKYEDTTTYHYSCGILIPGAFVR